MRCDLTLFRLYLHLAVLKNVRECLSFILILYDIKINFLEDFLYMKKTFLSIGLGIAVWAAGSAGAENLAGILAVENGSHLISIADRQAQLSMQIAKGYLQSERNGTDHKLALSIKALKAGQAKLKNSISDPELQNLLKYLDICMNKLEKKIAVKFTPGNAESVDELSKTIEEGNRYVKNSLKASKKDGIKSIALLGI